MKQMLWKNGIEWNEIQQKLQKVPFLDINVEEWYNTVDKYQKIQKKCEQFIGQSSLVDQFKKRLESFKAILPLVQALKNQHLELIEEQPSENNQN